MYTLIKKSINAKINIKKIIRCSQCFDEFPSGYEYRMHWEKEHFYPYLKSNSFDHKRAIKEAQYKRNINRLISEIGNSI